MAAYILEMGGLALFCDYSCMKIFLKLGLPTRMPETISKTIGLPTWMPETISKIRVANMNAGNYF